MRLITFIVIVLLLGGIAYVGIFHRDLIFKKAGEGILLAEGYTPAKTPSEAMEQFNKAIKARNYNAAAVYVTADYGEQLKRANDAAGDVGTRIDQVMNLAKDKGLLTDKSIVLLWMLDPFPTDFKVKDVQKKDATQGFGQFMFDNPPLPPASVNPEVARMDSKMLQNVLKAPSLHGTVEIVAEGQGDEKHWKLKVPLIPAQRMAIDHFLNNYKTYRTGLSEDLVVQVRNGRLPSKKEFEGAVVDMLIKAK